jgi:hypothetical protein
MRWSERPPAVRLRFASLQRLRCGLHPLPVAVAHLGLVRPRAQRNDTSDATCTAIA